MTMSLYAVYKRSPLLRDAYWRLRETERGLRFRWRSFLLDRSLGIETSVAIDRAVLKGSEESRRHAWSYVACDSVRFAKIMKHLDIDPARFAFVDIGSGKGRVVFMADRLGFASLEGVEFSPELHETAMANLASYRRRTGSRTPIAFHNQDALEYALPTGPCVVFMFNPFREAVMRPFVRKLQEAARTRGQDLRIVYVHPTEEHIFCATPDFDLAWSDRRDLDAIILAGRSQSNC